MADIVPFTGITACDIPVDRVLDAAKKAGLKSVIVIGETEDGEEYHASSIGDCAELNWMLDRCKMDLFKVLT